MDTISCKVSVCFTVEVLAGQVLNKNYNEVGALNVTPAKNILLVVDGVKS